MKREYVAVMDGEGRAPDEIVKSCVAWRRAGRWPSASSTAISTS